MTTTGRRIVFLPASDVTNLNHGRPPVSLSWPWASQSHIMPFAREVWYNTSVREQALQYLKTLAEESPSPCSFVLVGFSKSGLGALNLATEIPDQIEAVVIFDAPVARLSLPPWNTEAFYENDEQWQRDMPICRVNDYARVFNAKRKLILISGSSFFAEMRTFSEALDQARVAHTFLDRPDLLHRWDNGWVELAIHQLTGVDTING